MDCQLFGDFCLIISKTLAEFWHLNLKQGEKPTANRWEFFNCEWGVAITKIYSIELIALINSNWYGKINIIFEHKIPYSKRKHKVKHCSKKKREIEKITSSRQSTNTLPLSNIFLTEISSPLKVIKRKTDDFMECNDLFLSCFYLNAAKWSWKSDFVSF